MKMMGNILDCRFIRREIEEAGPADSLSLNVSDHLDGCAACGVFFNEQVKLRELVSSLGTVAAPADFDFRLRARLAGEKPKAAHWFIPGNLSLGSRAGAFASLLLVIGLALGYVGLKPGPDTQTSAGRAATSPAVGSAVRPGASNGIAKAVGVAAPVNPSSDQLRIAPVSLKETNRPAIRRRPAASQFVATTEDRITSSDMASTQARIIKADNLVADAGRSVFPIESSGRPLKVSLDNGRGSSRTVSLPGVSFGGSQRTLTQNSTPLLASAHGAW